MLSLTNLGFNKAPRDAYYKCSLICAAAAMQSPVWRGIGTQKPSSFVHNQLSDNRDVDCTSGEQGIGKGGKETREGWEFKGIYHTASQNWTNPVDMRRAWGLCTHCSYQKFVKTRLQPWEYPCSNSDLVLTKPRKIKRHFFVKKTQTTRNDEQRY